MDQIRAFVGHSFLEDGAPIVSRFLSYFDQIAKLLPNFHWEHAEGAEPKLLTKKVLALIDDKNTFIGICTKIERVANDSDFSNMVLRPSFRKIKESELQWRRRPIGLFKKSAWRKADDWKSFYFSRRECVSQAAYKVT